ncbi:MAG: hypothetical protein ACK4JB_17380 [Reyranella sp.]
MAKPRPPGDPRIAQLPGQLRPVAELCGFDGVTRLLEHFAGQEIYVAAPENAARSKIGQACGPQVARALGEVYGSPKGRRMRIPLAKGLSTDAKHQAIMSDRRSANAVARDLGMHVDSVHRIRAGRGKAPRRTDTRQGGLF